jgi:excisionase family DNA binding protein
MSEIVEIGENLGYDGRISDSGRCCVLLKSPEERTNFWANVASAEDEEKRELLLRALGKDVLEEIHSEFDLYNSYEDPFVETFVLLDRCELLLDKQMFGLYQELHEDQGGKRLFGEIIDRLAQISGDNKYDPPQRTCAADLYVMWREHVGPSEQHWLTVAEVAKRYGVVVQTVYKWIDQGKLSARKTPGGGGTRIAAREIAAHETDASLAQLAAEALHEKAVGPVRRIVRDRPAYEKVLDAIEDGRIPQLPRRRYLPDRARSLERADVLVPVTEHVEKFRESPKARGRKAKYRGQED